MGLTFEDFCGGWIGGICGLIASHPLDTIKVREQTYGTSIWKASKNTIKYDGILGFYNGLLFPLLTIGPSNAIFFGVYGNTLDLLLPITTKRTHNIQYHDRKAIRSVFVAGCIAGFFQAVFTCPFDVIKTIAQSQTRRKDSFYDESYSTSWNIFKRVLKKYGVKGLYRGGTLMMIRDVPTSGLYTASYELLYSSFVAKSAYPLMLKEMIAGGLAGIASWAFVGPVDLIKSRIQADNPAKPIYQGIIHCIQTSYKERGLRIFYHGFPLILLSAFVRNGVIFLGYEQFLRLFHGIVQK